MKAINPMTELATSKGGEYTQKTVQESGRPSTIPAKGQAPKSAMVDGPFGGKKPA